MTRTLFSFFLSVMLSVGSSYAANICILSWHGYLPEKTFLSESVNRPFIELKKIASSQGHNVKFVENFDQFKDADHIILFNIQVPLMEKIVKAYPEKNKLLFLWEPPVVDMSNYITSYHRYFSQVFTWDDTLVHKKSSVNYRKLYYIIDNLTMINDLVPFEKRKFCTLIAGNRSSRHPRELYSERLKAIKYFERFHPKQFEFYGRGWPRFNYKTYHGEIGNKIDYLKNYKYCICYENMHPVTGYITEKIFDCFIAGCVPVYLGAVNIAQHIPKECYIDRRNFNTYEELYTFLRTISKSRFNRYINAIKAFCTSRQARRFSIDYFAEKLLLACGLEKQN